jgi:hypothetical protein
MYMHTFVCMSLHTYIAHVLLFAKAFISAWEYIHMCVCVCGLYVFIHICTYICIYIYLCMYACIQDGRMCGDVPSKQGEQLQVQNSARNLTLATRTHEELRSTHTHIRRHPLVQNTYSCLHANTHMCMWVCVHVRACTYTYASIWTYTYACACILWKHICGSRQMLCYTQDCVLGT